MCWLVNKLGEMIILKYFFELGTNVVSPISIAPGSVVGIKVTNKDRSVWFFIVDFTTKVVKFLCEVLDLLYSLADDKVS